MYKRRGARNSSFRSKGIRKSKFTRKRRPTFNKSVKRVMMSCEETKYHTADVALTSLNSSVVSATNRGTSITTGQCVNLTGLAIPVGTSQNQRIGNTINNVVQKIQLDTWNFINGTYNVPNCFVRMIIFTPKNVAPALTNIIAFTDFWRVVSPTYMECEVNKKLYTVHKDNTRWMHRPAMSIIDGNLSTYQYTNHKKIVLIRKHAKIQFGGTSLLIPSKPSNCTYAAFFVETPGSTSAQLHFRFNAVVHNTFKDC